MENDKVFYECGCSCEFETTPAPQSHVEPIATSIDTMREAAKDVLVKRGWKPGNTLGFQNITGLMAEFGMQVYRGEIGCDYPNCGCCADAACGDAVKQHPDLGGTPPQPPLRGLTLASLQRSHIERQEEWCPDQKPDLSFRGNELGGECGEAQNVIKKLERERHGWRGSRDTVEHLAEELADVIHCAVLCAITAGIDVEPAVIAKFDNTSKKNGLSTFLAATAAEGSDNG